MANRKNTTSEKEPNLRGLLVALLALVLACCVYTFIQNPSEFNAIIPTVFSSAPLSLLIAPPLEILLVSAFCCLALYLLLAKRSIGKFATAITLIFGAVALCFVVAAVPGIGRTCGELACSTTDTFSLGVLLLLNPFANLLWNILSVTGIVLLARKLKKS